MDGLLATKTKAAKVRNIVRRVYVPGPKKKKFDFVGTLTMYQALCQAHINHEKLTYKTDC